MNVVKVLMLASVVGLGWHLWSEHRRAHADAALVASNPDGFVPVAMPGGAKPGVVLILAPEDCPSEAAQRAAALAEQLGRRGVPAQRSSHYSVEVSNPTDEERQRVDRAVAVLNGEIPAVFVNGMGKANPSVDDVVAAYRRSK